MRPKPWSWSSLSDFVNCPRSYYEKRIAKSVVETKGEATVWGEEVHKHFEDRLADGVVLPRVLEMHEDHLARLEAMAGTGYTEQKIALSMKLQPCEFFAPDAWFAAVVPRWADHS